MFKISTARIAGFGFCLVCLSPDNHLSGKNIHEEIFADSSLVSEIKTQEVFYNSNGKRSRGYIAYDENLKGKLPVVIIVHEWWGINDYAKSRARKIEVPSMPTQIRMQLHWE
jgi:hypothetical protein